MALVAGFKDVLSRWASGVAVVTTQSEGLLYGLTVSSFTSLSLDPPLILVCIDNANRWPAMVAEGGGFAVSILDAQQQAASAYFARSGRLPTPNFTEIEGEWTEAGQPVVRGALAWLVCALEEQLVRGDHTIVIGRVVQAQARGEGSPLVYYHRGYRQVT